LRGRRQRMREARRRTNAGLRAEAVSRRQDRARGLLLPRRATATLASTHPLATAHKPVRLLYAPTQRAELDDKPRPLRLASAAGAEARAAY
jgi:hypothetical protein